MQLHSPSATPMHIQVMHGLEADHRVFPGCHSGDPASTCRADCGTRLAAVMPMLLPDLQDV